MACGQAGDVHTRSLTPGRGRPRTRTVPVRALLVLSALCSTCILPEMPLGQSIAGAQLFRKVDVPSQAIRQASYLPDGKTFVVCTHTELTVVDTKTLRRHKIPADVFLALSQDGQRLVTATPFVQDRNRVAGGPVLPDGQRAFVSRRVTDGVAGPLTVWDVTTRQPIGELQWQPEWDWPNRHFLHPDGCAFLPDRRTLACGYVGPAPAEAKGPGAPGKRASSPYQVGLWNVDTGNLLATWGVEEEPSSVSAGTDIRKLSLAVSPDGKFLATCYHEGTPSVNLIGPRPFDKLFLCEVPGGTIKHRLIDDALARLIPLFAASRTRGVAYSPDGARIAASVVDGYGWSAVIVWEAATGKFRPLRGKSLSGEKQRVFDLPKGRDEKQQFILPANGFSPDGRFLVLIGGPCPVIVEVESRTPVSGLKVTQGHARPIKAAAFSPDGKVLATVAEDEIRFWNLTHRQLGMTPRGG